MSSIQKFWSRLFIICSKINILYLDDSSLEKAGDIIIKQIKMIIRFYLLSVTLQSEKLNNNIFNIAAIYSNNMAQSKN